MLKMVDGTGIIGVDMICPLGVSTPQPPNYDKVEVEGTGILVLPNSLDAPLERLELIGNSTQGENPAPDNPQEIKSAGRFDEASGKYLLDVKITGKNLLNLQKEPDVKGIYQGWKVGNGELLTLGVKDKGNNADIKGCYIGFSNQGSEPNGVVWVVDNGVIKAYPLTQRKAYVSIFPANETAVKKLTERLDIQCELGNVATTYQPYKEQTLTLTSDRPITKWDRLVEQGGEIGWLYGGKIIDSYNSEQIDAEYMSSTGSLTVGATVLYKLKTTEFVPLPQSEQNAIRALKTYYPTTVITVDGGEVDPDIEVTYRKEI